MVSLKKNGPILIIANYFSSRSSLFCNLTSDPPVLSQPALHQTSEAPPQCQDVSSNRVADLVKARLLLNAVPLT